MDIVRRNPDQYRVWALAAGRNAHLLAEQIREFRPRVAIVEAPEILIQLSEHLELLGIPRSEQPELSCGPRAMADAATAVEANVVMSAIVGVAGLEATFEAVLKGKRIGLANKEALVASGGIVMEAARRSGGEIIPVDSEHNGVHQCLRAGRREEVARIILTASGGPFRDTPVDRLKDVTPAQALNHPTWKMGRRITVDSATLMNKGFELIEACWLFGLPASHVEVVVHPQSTVHAMVEYVDGSVVAQLSTTDMRMPIQYALTHPERAAAPVPKLDWMEARTWQFFPPDEQKFPLLALARQAQQTGGSAGCTLNAADEIAVEEFLAGRIGFASIARVVSEALSRTPVREPRTIADVLAVDGESRALAREIARESPREFSIPSEEPVRAGRA